MNRYDRSITFTNIKPAVELVGNGVILPNTNGLIFPFKAVNLNSVTVRIIKVFQDNMAQFLQVNQLDGNYQMKRVGRLIYKEDIPLKSDKAIDYGSWNTFSLDLSKMIKAEPGAIYRVHISFNKEHSLYPCEGDEEEADEIDEASFDQGSGGGTMHRIITIGITMMIITATTATEEDLIGKIKTIPASGHIIWCVSGPS